MPSAPRVALLATGFTAACMPPPMNVGFVDLSGSGVGHVEIQGQTGAGAEVSLPLGGGGVVGHFEPFVARRVSIPIGTGLGISGDGSGARGHLPLRVGFRHRAVPRHFAWGAGLGPSVVFTSGGTDASGVADLEIIAGTRARHFGFSFGIRPAFSFNEDDMTFYALFEPAFAIPLRHASFTIGFVAGPWVTPTVDGTPAGGFLGATFGLHRRF